MEAQLPWPTKVCPHAMVHSRHIRTCYTRPPIIFEAWSHAAELHHTICMTHPTCQEDQPLSVRKSQVTHCTSGNQQCSTDNHPFLHSTPARMSLPLTPIALKELDALLEHTQSTFVMMQNLSSMHTTSVLLPCIHLCVRSWMNSSSRRS